MKDSQKKPVGTDFNCEKLPSSLADLFGLVLFLSAVYAVTGCSISHVQRKMDKCITISIGTLTGVSEVEFFSSFCENVECNIKCYVDAIGDCYTKDEFIMYEPEVFKVTSRAFCSNQNETLLALRECKWTDSSCLDDFTSASDDASEMYNKQQYGDYKNAYCEALTQLLSCVGFSTSSTCTSELVDIVEDMYKASLSYRSCGIEEHPYFYAYSGDVTCAGNIVQWTASNIFLFIMTFFLF